jgi:hypothetical protein
LDKYPYSGHSTILGNTNNSWQEIDKILRLFHEKRYMARRHYRNFIQKGIKQGKRPDLVGGGLVRSVGGWSALKSLRQAKIYQKGDERILGDGDFVEQTLKAANEAFSKHRELISIKLPAVWQIFWIWMSKKYGLQEDIAAL